MGGEHERLEPRRCGPRSRWCHRTLQAFLAELAQRLEQPVAAARRSATTIDLSTSAATGRSTSTAVEVVVGADRFGAGEVEPAGEDRQPVEQEPLLAGQQLVGPLHGGPQRLVALRPPGGRPAAAGTGHRAGCARSASGIDRTRAAASSMASGMPSSRRAQLGDDGQSSSASAEAAVAAPARSQNSSAAAPASSDGTARPARPARRAARGTWPGPRTVGQRATTARPARPRRRARARSCPAPAAACGSAARRPRSDSDSPSCGRSASVVATACATRRDPRTEASSHNHTPSGNCRPTPAADLRAPGGSCPPRPRRSA